MSAAFEVRDRIKGLITVESDEVLDHPHQWREHGEEQVSALRSALEVVGMANVIIVYRSERAEGALVAIDGHGRKNQSGVTTWKALELDVNDAEADFILATLDPINAMAKTNKVKYQDLYDALPLQGEAIQMTLDSVLGARMPNKDLEMRVPDGMTLEGGDAIGGMGLTMAIPEAAVRMVQLYLDTKTHPQLLQWVDALSEPMNTANITETVMACVEFAYEVIINGTSLDGLMEGFPKTDPVGAYMEQHPAPLPPPDLEMLASVPAVIDTVYVCARCNIGWDEEDMNMGGGRCPDCGEPLLAQPTKKEA